MTGTHPSPPRVADVLLRALVKPTDAESIPGDLLEEYREVRRPRLGRLRADAWYVRQVLSVLWRVTWPCLAAIAALRVVSFPLPAEWNPSLVPAPGVSLVDALLLVWAGYYGSQRTGTLATGLVTAGTASALGFFVFIASAAATGPTRLLAPLERPFVVVILLTLLVIALSFGLAAGAVGALAGRWVPGAPRHARLI